jgi:hypothetical protein
MDSESADSAATRLLRAFFDAPHRNEEMAPGDAGTRAVVTLPRVAASTAADDASQLASWPLPWPSA